MARRTLISSMQDFPLQEAVKAKSITNTFYVKRKQMIFCEYETQSFSLSITCKGLQYLCTILHLSLSLFVPPSNFFVVQKWNSLYKDPHGENVFELSASWPSFSSGVNGLRLGVHDRMKALSERISELEERLLKYEVLLTHDTQYNLFSKIYAHMYSSFKSIVLVCECIHIHTQTQYFWKMSTYVHIIIY